MSSRYPTGPFCVPDQTPVCDREALLVGLAADGADDPGLRQLAQRVAASATARAAAADRRTRDWFRRLLAEEALRAAQALPYVGDESGRDCYQPVAYTLARGGECKALTVVYVAALRALGVRGEPVWITQTGQPLNHVAAQVDLDDRWTWADASIRGAALGESPYDALRRTGQWHVVGGVVPAGRPASAAAHAALPAITATSGNVPWPPPWWSGVWQRWPAWAWRRYFPNLYVPFGHLYDDAAARGEVPAVRQYGVGVP